MPDDDLVPLKIKLPWREIQALKREALDRSEPGAEVTCGDLVLEALRLRRAGVRTVLTDHDKKEAKKK